MDTEVTKRMIISTDLVCCARCGNNHPKIQFKKFNIPIEEDGITQYNFWGMCPDTNEPILVKVKDDGGKLI